MSISWTAPTEPLERPSGLGWFLVAVRLMALAVIIFGLMGPMVLCRLLGLRGAAQSIVKVACNLSLRVIGLRIRIEGTPMRHGGAVVANHASWLDIFVMNAVQKVSFVAKSDVSGWPVIGLIARSTGTVFIKRKSTDAGRQRQTFLARLKSGDRLLFFPEGTSTDGLRVLPFRSALFAAFFDPELKESVWIQPMSVLYKAPDGKRASFYGWWGDMGFAAHFMMVLCQRRQGGAHVILHRPIQIAQLGDRKQAARLAETAVRSAFNG